MTALQEYVYRVVEHYARMELQAKKGGDMKDAARNRQIIEHILREYRSQSLEPEGD